MKNGKKVKYENYLEFLKTRLESENFRNNVTVEEYDKTKNKYEREKLKQKLLGNQQPKTRKKK